MPTLWIRKPRHMECKHWALGSTWWGRLKSRHYAFLFYLLKDSRIWNAAVLGKKHLTLLQGSLLCPMDPFVCVFMLVPWCFNYDNLVVNPEIVWCIELCSFCSRSLCLVMVCCGSKRRSGFFFSYLWKMSFEFW